MKAVLDTGVFISALISSQSVPYKAVELWIDKRFDLITSEYYENSAMIIKRLNEVVKPLLHNLLDKCGKVTLSTFLSQVGTKLAVSLLRKFDGQARVHVESINAQAPARLYWLAKTQPAI